MNRFEAELSRLYGVTAHGDAPLDTADRVMVLTLLDPLDWGGVARLWQGVQDDLGWPAPAIAVDGRRAYQLWFALVEPLPVAQVQVCLAGLCRRYLPSLPAERWTAYPGGAVVQVPGAEVVPGQWSAFVAPDLAALFADTPWLDGPPGQEAQADLLARFGLLKPALLSGLMGPGEREPGDGTAGVYTDAQAFLRDVMNNAEVAWQWRIEAAKALLNTARTGERP